MKQNDKNGTKPKGEGSNLPLTFNQGTTIQDDFNTLPEGSRDPCERIPRRVVHARGAGSCIVSKLHTPILEFTQDGLFSDIKRETEVFVRFSTVVGSKGFTYLAGDVRGFAIKSYTGEGVFDLAGNNKVQEMI